MAFIIHYTLQCSFNDIEYFFYQKSLILVYILEIFDCFCFFNIFLMH